jgi:hypothetical protein
MQKEGDKEPGHEFWEMASSLAYRFTEPKCSVQQF